MDQIFILLNRQRKVVGLRTLEEIRPEFPSAAKEIDERGYYVGVHSVAPDMLQPDFFRMNGKRYKTIERAIEDNPTVDSVVVSLNDCGEKRVLSVPIKLLDFLRQKQVTALQAKVAVQQAEVDALRRWTARFEEALEADRKNPSLNQ
jgi:hypothetical protein